MASENVELTIITPTYNRLPYLQSGWETMLHECCGRPVEWIVADDCSTDRTWQWLKDVLEPSHPQVSSVRTRRNRGPGPARNMALARARGRFVVSVDSDMILMEGGVDRILESIADYRGRRLLFFPCVGYSSRRRMDPLSESRDVSWEDFLYESVRGEMIPVFDRLYLESKGLKYPEFRSGGESILWVRAMRETAARYVDAPILYHRTDAPNRICTAEYQLRHAADLAEIADGMLALFPEELAKQGRRAKARRLLAAGSYHLIAGNRQQARMRLREAASHGNLTAPLVWLASFLGLTRPVGRLALAAERS